MRCPYCGGFNPDRATFCAHCGRDVRPQASPAAGHQPPYQPQHQPGRPGAAPQPPRPASPPPVRVASPPTQQTTTTQPRRSSAPSVQVPPPAPPPPPEPPASFPPRTLAELQALEPGALTYDVLESGEGDGRKKVVRIIYPKGVAWQQVATLLKAFKEQQEERYETIIIQGVLDKDTTIYTFTNGQLRFDRNVRLGSAILNRYLIETGNGFENDAVRIVLTE